MEEEEEEDRKMEEDEEEEEEDKSGRLWSRGMKDLSSSWTNQDMFWGGTLGDERTVHVTLTL